MGYQSHLWQEYAIIILLQLVIKTRLILLAEAEDHAK